jgi:phosphatidylglycerol:prolipoprotein diacylglycerol transferase
LALCDLVAPSMVLGLALGRVGCLLNGCCFGGVSDVPWSITFPADSPPYRDQRDQGELADVVLAENNGRVVVERIVSEAARSAGLKPGDEIAGISGKLEDSTLMLRLGTKPKIELVPPEKSFDPKIKDSLPRDAKPGLSRDVEEWLEKHEKLLESGKPNKRLLAAQDTLQALSYPNIAVDTADGRHVAWKLPARSLPVQPAQIYSTVDALLICIFLLAYYPYRRRDGEVLALMLTIYPVTRFLIEIIRVDEAGQFGTKLSISQWVSMGVLAGVAVLWVYVLRQPKGQLWANGG